MLDDGTAEPAPRNSREHLDVLDLRDAAAVCSSHQPATAPSTTAASTASDSGRHVALCPFSCGGDLLVAPRLGEGRRHPGCRQVVERRPRRTADVSTRRSGARSCASTSASKRRSRAPRSSPASPGGPSSTTTRRWMTPCERVLRLGGELGSRNGGVLDRQVVVVVDVPDRAARKATPCDVGDGALRGVCCRRLRGTPAMRQRRSPDTHELGEPPLEEAALGPVGVERERAVVRGARLVGAPEPAQQLGARGVEVAVAVEVERVDERQRRRRARRPRRSRRRGSARRPASGQRARARRRAPRPAPVARVLGVQRRDRGLQGVRAAAAQRERAVERAGPRRSARGPTARGPGRRAARARRRRSARRAARRAAASARAGRAPRARRASARRARRRAGSPRRRGRARPP